MNRTIRKKGLTLWAFISLEIAIVILAVTIGFFAHRYYQEQQGDLHLLKQARNIVVDNTINPIPDETTFEYGMIRGMLGTLNDPYTYFVEPAPHEVQSNELAGSYGGIGARLEQDTSLNWRLYPFLDSPASTAGIQDGDLLHQVDDLVVTAEIDEVTLLAALRGPVGDSVRLVLERDGEMLTFIINRQSIPLPSISYNLLPEDKRIGLIKINRIAETTAEEIEEGILDLQMKGGKAMILDLRDNGGGLVEAGIAISRLFLEKGEILQQQFKDGDVQHFKVEKAGPFSERPLIVLINGNTASAAEIVAGALQYHNRATLIGTPSFGKTTIQYVFDLQDGSSIHVTSGRWWITGVDFPISPDILIATEATQAEFMQTVIEVLRKNLN